MKIQVVTKNGEKKEDLTLSKLFDVEIGSKTLTQYINYLRSALRSPVANTKDRGAVSGGGRKPWRQKGTGNARAGSNRSPLWVGGGVTFGPTRDQNFHVRINGKTRKRVILSILADFVKNKKLTVIEEIHTETPKTKEAAATLANLKSEGKISVILSKEDGKAPLSFRNIAGVYVMSPYRLDVINLLSSDQVIISKSALSEIEVALNPDKVKEVKNNE